MATYVKRRGPEGRWVWQVKVRKRGCPQQTRTFDLKSEAQTWARIIESEMTRGVWRPSAEAEATTLGEALERYASEIIPRKRHSHREYLRVAMWCRLPLARRSLASIRGKDIADYIREREAGEAGPNTIRLDLALLSHLFTVARSRWGMEPLGNPVALVKGARPKLPRSRDRRLFPEEEPRLLAACRAYGGPIEPIVAIALATAMRRGEIAAMRWEHLDRGARVLLVPETKTGESRRVPLSSMALAVLDALPRRIDGYAWGVRADTVTQASPGW